MTTKRKAINLETKKRIIDGAEEGMKSFELCKKFDLDRKTISKIIKNKEIILNAIEKGGNAKRVRIFGGKNKDLDDALLAWVKLQRSNNIPINGPILKVSFC